MTEHAGPRPTTAVPHDRRPGLRVVGGTDVAAAGTGGAGTAPAGTGDDAPSAARAASARAAHPSSGAGVGGARRLRLVVGERPPQDAGMPCLSVEDLAVIIRMEDA